MNNEGAETASTSICTATASPILGQKVSGRRTTKLAKEWRPRRTLSQWQHSSELFKSSGWVLALSIVVLLLLTSDGALADDDALSLLASDNATSPSADLNTDSSQDNGTLSLLTVLMPQAASRNSTETSAVHFQLITFNWEHISTPFCVSLWILMASVAKILFNVHKKFAEAVPDSALLIVLGIALGSMLRLLDVDASVFTLRAPIFFLYLLPPIIFDAGYFMPNRQLFENLDSVLLFAFLGTIWNTLAIGFSLLWLGHLALFSVPFSAFQILLFASLISAVDPVAVIAVFEEIHINEFLFINVFGEALFNDGVSVVLYQMFRKFIAIGFHNLDPVDYVAGIGSFLVIALGGVFIGLLFAWLACIATRFTSRVRILAPVFVFVIPYISYLSAEMFGLSSILAIVACGIAMKQYVKGNMSHDACASVKYFVKMLAQCSETVIFMFLGLSAASSNHHWDWAFVGATIAFCLLFRVIGVVVQCAVLNRFRAKKFSYSDQFVLSYGGLRGAIAFGLVVSLEGDFPAKNMFVSTCIAVIFFTVFVQGITIRPLLHWLKVEKQDADKEETMAERICSRHCDFVMAGIEDIAGMRGKNSVRDTFERFNAKVLKPVLMRGEHRKDFDVSPIIRAYTKITLTEAQRLARASGRKHSTATTNSHRVAPSPSSATSTLTYCQWTVDEKRGPTNQEPRSRTTSHSSDGANNHKNEDCGLEEHLPNGGEEQDRIEALYAVFSRLLDRKVNELQATSSRTARIRLRPGGGERAENDDIEDNYMETLIRVGRKQKVAMPGGEVQERRRHSLSPAIERQMGQRGASSAEHLRGLAAARRLFIGNTHSEPLRSRHEQHRQRAVGGESGEIGAR